MTRVVRPLLGLVFVCALTLPLHGAGARFWEVATLADFLKGDVNNLSIDLHGRLVLGPALTEVAAPTAPVLWTGLVADDGSLLVGSGNDGQVLRVARDGALSTLFDSAELEVHALARAPGGGVYVGTSPDGRIYKVDAAGKSAQDARQAANVADEKAVSAAKKADAVEAATRRLVYEVVLSEDQGNFKFGKAELPEEAKARIDEMVNQLKADPKAIYIEIEGHTDSVGTNHMNDTLGLERAEAVKRYLYEAHQVPLHKMNAISFGEEKPVAPNNTKQGRAQNRRVVIKVLA